MPAARRRASNALLLAGYAMAAGAAVKLVPAWRERRGGRIVVFEAGTACVTAGLVLRRKWLPAATNGITLVGVAAAWVATRRR